MKITIVMGHSDLMPPDSGDFIARCWHNLSVEFSRQGHEVTILSRRWRGTPSREVRDSVRHVRIPGFDRSRRRMKNFFRDFWWSNRIIPELPPADVTVIVGGLFLPMRLGLFRRRCGSLVFMPAGFSKRRYALARRIDCILAISTPMKRLIVRARPRLEPRVQVVGVPIDWRLLSRAKPEVDLEDPVTIGYVGRIHPDKGLDVLISAIELLNRMNLSQPWRVVISNLRDSSSGRGSETYAAAIERRLTKELGPDRFLLRSAPKTNERLVASYYEIDVFCYPSLQRHREIFSAGVVEAMASGAVPVVADLPFFHDIIEAGITGQMFDPHVADSPERLARILHGLVSDSTGRRRMSEAARMAVYRYDCPLLASRLLADFATLAIANE